MQHRAHERGISDDAAMNPRTSIGAGNNLASRHGKPKAAVSGSARNKFPASKDDVLERPFL